MSSNGVKNYTESESLLQYQGKIELNPDDPSYIAQKNRETSDIDNNPSLSETLNAMFLPIKNLFNTYLLNQPQEKKQEIYLKP